jgi:anti-sigma regulatory factor (Ser/Thr protein kinase)
VREQQASLELAATTIAPRSARRFVADTLRHWGEVEVTGRAELIASELVTNVVRHAGTACRLVLAQNDRFLRIEVVDFGAGVAVRRNPRVDDVSGRGLLLVEAMADQWGAAHDGEEHRVWCEIAL